MNPFRTFRHHQPLNLQTQALPTTLAPIGPVATQVELTAEVAMAEAVEIKAMTSIIALGIAFALTALDGVRPAELTEFKPDTIALDEPYLFSLTRYTNTLTLGSFPTNQVFEQVTFLNASTSIIEVSKGWTNIQTRWKPTVTGQSNGWWIITLEKP